MRSLSSITFVIISLQSLKWVSKKTKKTLPTLYWLPKLRKRPDSTRFIANSSLCTITAVSKHITVCLTTVKIRLSISQKSFNHIVKLLTKGKLKHLWPIRNSSEVLNKFKSKGFTSSILSAYDFYTLYTSF